MRQLLGSNLETFYKSPSSNVPTDAFNDLGLHLYYTENGELEFVEAFEPCTPAFKDIVLLRDDASDVAAELSSLGHQAVQDDAGYGFPDLGFGLYAPLGHVEGVSVYPKGYYDDANAT